MRRGRKGGTCGVCGAKSEEGLYWEPFYFTTDFGVLDTPIEFHDMSQPIRCDKCETKSLFQRSGNGKGEAGSCAGDNEI